MSVDSRSCVSAALGKGTVPAVRSVCSAWAHFGMSAVTVLVSLHFWGEFLLFFTLLSPATC